MADVLGKLAAVFRKQRLDRELDDEIAFHLEMEAQENQRRGMTPEQARRAARKNFGGVEQMKEEFRDVRGAPAFETLVRDLRYGLRNLVRNPGFAAVATLSLALGIGANTAIFSVVDAALLRRLPVEEPDRLLFLSDGRSRGMFMGDVPSPLLFSYPWFEELRRDNTVFTDLAAFGSIDWTVYVRDPEAGAAASPEGASVRLISGNYFGVLGVRPAVGRLIAPEDAPARGAHPVIVLSHGYWLRRFGGDPGAAGRSLLVNGERFTVIGVTSPAFRGETVGESPDLWMPLTMQRTVARERDFLDQRDLGFLLLAGRLRPDANVEQAAASLTVQYQRMARADLGDRLTPEFEREIQERRIEPAHGERGLSSFGRSYRRALWLLQAVAGLVLLIACANIANLLLARAEARRREMGVRLALGAARGRLLRQLLTENLLLAAAGAALGLVIAAPAARMLLAMVSPGGAATPLDVTLDGRALVFTLAVAAATALLFGLAPAFRAARVDVAPALHGSMRGTGGSRSSRLSRTLVAAQVGVSLLLLVAAGLFLRTLNHLRAADLGFQPKQTLIVRIDPQGSGVPRREVRSLNERLLDRVEALPGVRSASLSFRPLLDNARRTEGVEVEGYTFREGEADWVTVTYVTPSYFETVGIPIRRGRAFTDGDRSGTPLVAIVNQAFARRFFATADPLGKRVTLNVGPDDSASQLQIAGVAGDARFLDVRDEAEPLLYAPAWQMDEYLNSLEIRTAGAAAPSEAEIRAAIREVSPDLAVAGVTPLWRTVEEELRQERAITQLTIFFGALALLLAALGLYGVMSYAVSRRTGEIGVRMALGAASGQVLRQTLRESLRLVAAGAVAGLAASLAATRLASSLLYGVSERDPLTFAAAAAALSVVAVAAAWIPARRAARVSPVTALRHE